MKDRKKFLFIACFQFFVVLSVRSNEVGADTVHFYPFFYEEASSMSLISIISEWKFIGQFYLPSGRGAESGFTLLNWIFGGLLGFPYRVFIIFLALIGAIALYKYLERNSRAPLLGAMTMYIYLLRESAYFTALRRSTALTFILFALIAMEDRKLMKAALILLFGATMHMSALLFLPLLAIMHIKITRKLFLKTYSSYCCGYCGNRAYISELNAAISYAGRESRVSSGHVRRAGYGHQC